MEPWQISALGAVVLIGLELASGTFILLGCGLALVFVAALQAANGDFWALRDVPAFLVVTAVAIKILRQRYGQANADSLAQSDINKY